MPSITEMVLDHWLTAARSVMPSPLKSPETMETGAVPAGIG